MSNLSSSSFSLSSRSIKSDVASNISSIHDSHQTKELLIFQLKSSENKLINILILRQLLLTKKLLKAPLFALKIYKNLPIKATVTESEHDFL